VQFKYKQQWTIFNLWFLNPYHVIDLRGLEIRPISLVSWFSSKPMRFGAFIIQRYENHILEDTGDLDTILTSWCVLNLAIEAPSSWLNLNHPRLLYIACMGHQNHHQRTKSQQTLSHIKPMFLFSFHCWNRNRSSPYFLHVSSS
jgi:hypothetical protein